MVLKKDLRIEYNVNIEDRELKSGSIGWIVKTQTHLDSK